jgi:DNA-binding CsgD family transcriptional regulator
MDLHLHDLAYQRKIGHLIEVLDQPDFWGQLVRGVRSFIDFDNWVVLCFSAAGPPQVYSENPGADGGTDMLFLDYLNGLYLLDPFFVASRDHPRSGLVLLDEVAPENFAATDYYRLYFHLNIVADEIQFNCRLDATRTLCFSIGRGSRYRPEEVAALSVMAAWVVPLMSQRHKLECLRDVAPATPAAPETPASRDNVADLAFGRLQGSRLTPREVEIGQLMLGGFSAKDIAQKLGISIETVRAHKKHIYAKLEINSQSELFAIFYRGQPAAPD